MISEKKRHTIDAGLGILVMGLIGARIGYVLINLPYFRNNLSLIPQFWLGGLTWPGALVGAGLAFLSIRLIWKQTVADLADNLLPLLGIVVVTIWLTGWGAGIAYGPRIEAWFGIPVRDIFGNVETRWPLPIIGAALSAGWIAGIIFLPLKRWNIKPGVRAVLGTAGIVLINGVISLFRVNPAPQFLGIRGESWFTLVLIICSVGIYFSQREKTKDDKIDS
ncbi:MAG: prolipoprotein diacylglyceryl transferase [Anaerolineales bacterium]|nr:prolipoprotein diacylglyceryl transferase [Anaerolineales bacterium]